MMDVAAAVAFAAAAALLTITPGLDTALVLRTAAVEGTSEARFAAVGICTGLLIWGTATSLGLTALLALSTLAYNTVRIAGAAYLVFLGMQMLVQKRKLNLETALLLPRNGSGARRWLARGLLCNVLNPKVGIFYVTLLPQFIPRGSSVAGYGLLFTSIHVAEGLLWLTFLTMAVRSLGSWISRPRVTRSLDCTTGTVLIGCGIALALEHRR